MGNSDKLKQLYPKGKPVAWNKCRVALLTLHYDDNGTPYFTWFKLPGYRRIQKKWYPLGDTLYHPAKWGRERAVMEFIDWYEADDLRQMENLKKRLGEWKELRERELGKNQDLPK